MGARGEPNYGQRVSKYPGQIGVSAPAQPKSIALPEEGAPSFLNDGQRTKVAIA
jgi:hypothetical protein